jgi:hypothetical protein
MPTATKGLKTTRPPLQPRDFVLQPVTIFDELMCLLYSNLTISKQVLSKGLGMGMEHMSGDDVVYTEDVEERDGALRHVELVTTASWTLYPGTVELEHPTWPSILHRFAYGRGYSNVERDIDWLIESGMIPLRHPENPHT